MFIAFEGLDGSGSSTQSRLLIERLQAAGKEVLMTKEPTSDAPLGTLIREVLQHKHELSPEAFQLLFCADRAEHLKNTVQPALDAGTVVISDRYLFSTLAYGAMNVEYDWLKALNQNFPLPDVTFLLKADPELCLQRIAARGSEVEFFEKKEKLEKIWTHYEKVAQDFPNIHILDAHRTPEEVDGEVWELLETKIPG